MDILTASAFRFSMKAAAAHVGQIREMHAVTIPTIVREFTMQRGSRNSAVV